MKITIDIPEQVYKDCLEYRDTSNTTIYNAIRKGVKVMRLSEAIEHAVEIAEHNEKNAKKYEEKYKPLADNCIKCAEEHRELARWLKDLQAFKDAYKEIRQTSGNEEAVEIIGKHLREVR